MVSSGINWSFCFPPKVVFSLPTLARQCRRTSRSQKTWHCTPLLLHSSQPAFMEHPCLGMHFTTDRSHPVVWKPLPLCHISQISISAESTIQTSRSGERQHVNLFCLDQRMVNDWDLHSYNLLYGINAVQGIEALHRLSSKPHRNAPHCTTPHRTAPHRTALHHNATSHHTTPWGVQPSCPMQGGTLQEKGGGAPSTPPEWAAWPRWSAVQGHAALARHNNGYEKNERGGLYGSDWNMLNCTPRPTSIGGFRPA